MENILGGTLNPRGLLNTVEFSAARPLYRSANPFLSRARLAAGLTHHLSPSYTGGAAWCEITPLSILELKAGAEHVRYLGSFGSLLPYGGYDGNFDENARDERWDDARARGGRRLFLSPVLKAKAGRLSFSTNVEWEWWKVHSPAPFFYEPRRDTILKRNDKLLRTTVVALYDLGGRKGTLQAGPLYQEMRVPSSPRNRMRRGGLLIFWDLPNGLGGFSQPRVIVSISQYLDDPFRKGEPFAALAFRFGGSDTR